MERWCGKKSNAFSFHPVPLHKSLLVIIIIAREEDEEKISHNNKKIVGAEQKLLTNLTLIGILWRFVRVYVCVLHFFATTTLTHNSLQKGQERQERRRRRRKHTTRKTSKIWAGKNQGGGGGGGGGVFGGAFSSNMDKKERHIGKNFFSWAPSFQYITDTQGAGCCVFYYDFLPFISLPFSRSAHC